MQKLFGLGLLVGLIAFQATRAPAVTLLEFAPPSQTKVVGDDVFVDVMVTPDAGQVVSAFDIDIGFNPSIIGFFDVDFGPYLGGEFDVFNSVDDSLALTGVVNVAALSLLDELALAALQPSPSFPLVTLAFKAIGVGTSPLTFESIIGPLEVKDNYGDPLRLDLRTGEVIVREPTPAPEPGTLALLGTGLLGLIGYGWYRRVEEV